MTRAFLFILGLIALSLSGPAQAQNVNLNCYVGPNAPQWLPCSVTNPLPVTGGGGGGGAVTIANGGNVVEGSTTDVPCTVPTSATACTIDAIAKAIANAINAATIVPGQTTKSASVPVVFPIDTNALQTYNVEVSGYTAYATPTDMICINGSASKIVRVTEMNMRIQSTAAALQTLLFIKRSTASTGGTPTTPTPTPYYSANAAATAVVTSYGSAPSPLGAAVGTLRINQIASATLTAGPGSNSIRANYLTGTGAGPNQYVTLNGVAESLCMNYAGAALTSGFTSVYGVEWTESAN